MNFYSATVIIHKSAKTEDKFGKLRFSLVYIDSSLESYLSTDSQCNDLSLSDICFYFGLLVIDLTKVSRTI